jgi:ribosomal protein S18 acetylase RimI-like enzyme
MAVREDAHDIARILKESADDGLVARSDEVDVPSVMRQLEAGRAAGNSLFIVAAVPTEKDVWGTSAVDIELAPPVPTHDDQVVGMLALEGAPLLRLFDVARLTMAVTPTKRDAGVGRALMQYAMEVADQSGRIRKIELLTRANNARALHLYTSLGFVEEGRLRARLRLDDGSYLDDVCMARFRPTSPSAPTRA